LVIPRDTRASYTNDDVTPLPIHLGSIDTDRRDASSQLTVHERLLISGLLVGVTLWIRVAEVIPELRHRA
jgi:hypothetical protein